MTLSFHKVNFSAQEVLDLLADVQQQHENCDQCTGLDEFEETFVLMAEDRSRLQPVTRLDRT